MKKYYLLSAMLATFSLTMAQELTTYSVFDVNHQDGTTVADVTSVVSRAAGTVTTDPQVVDAAVLNELLQELNRNISELKGEISDVKRKINLVMRESNIIDPLEPDENGVISTGHAYVDLGITDSNGKTVYWATCNVGATNPEDYGD